MIPRIKAIPATGHAKKPIIGIHPIKRAMQAQIVDANPRPNAVSLLLDLESGAFVSLGKFGIVGLSPPQYVFTSFSFASVPVNILTGSGYDPVTDTAELKVCPVRIELVN